MKKPRNKFETRLYQQLKKAKVSVKYESERIAYVIEGTYTPDYVLFTRKSRKKLFIEAKGYFRPEHKRKMVAVKKLHPHLDIRIVFYSYRKSDVRWAERYGFPCAIGTIPQEWLDE